MLYARSAVRQLIISQQRRTLIASIHVACHHLGPQTARDLADLTSATLADVDQALAQAVELKVIRPHSRDPSRYVAAPPPTANPGTF